MPAPLVSIILPTYNGDKHLGGAVACCLGQSYADLELIVVVDGSTDRTAEVLSTFNDPRLRIIDHQMNRGLPTALNTGLAEARGEFLSWTSDDNLYFPQAIKNMVRRLQKAMNEGRQLVYSDYFLFDTELNKLKRNRLRPPEQCLLSHNGLGACFLFTRELFESTGGYRVDLPGAEDYEYWLRAKKKFSFAHTKKTLYLYRQRPGSLTDTQRKLNADSTEKAMLEHQPLCEAALGENISGDGQQQELVTIGDASMGEATQEQITRLLSAGSFSALVYDPPLPDPIGVTGANSLRAVEIEKVEKMFSLILPGWVADIIGREGVDSSLEAAGRIFSQGGRIGHLLSSEKLPIQAVGVPWIRLGIRMNEADNHSFWVIVRRIFKTLGLDDGDLRRLIYLRGLLAGKIIGLWRHLMAPLVDRLFMPPGPVRKWLKQ